MGVRHCLFGFIISELLVRYLLSKASWPFFYRLHIQSLGAIMYP